MYIKELEVDNFKSFANTVNIPFMRGFTTISGPNGSGKSNIIDSILFALGLSTSEPSGQKSYFILFLLIQKEMKLLLGSRLPLIRQKKKELLSEEE